MESGEVDQNKIIIVSKGYSFKNDSRQASTSKNALVISE